MVDSWRSAGVGRDLAGEGAVREALEETGLTVDPQDFLGVFDRLMRDAAGQVLYHYVLVDFLCRRLGGELHAAGDAIEARWFSPKELPGLGLAEDTAAVVRLGFASGSEMLELCFPLTRGLPWNRMRSFAYTSSPIPQIFVGQGRRLRGEMAMWTFVQSTGELFHDGLREAQGYWGYNNPDTGQQGKNNPDLQNIPEVGPIPVGKYTIGSPHDTLTHGPFVLPLQPDAGNQMFGRTGFLIHGDSVVEQGTASRGCIILSRAMKNDIALSGDKSLRVMSGIATDTEVA